MSPLSRLTTEAGSPCTPHFPADCCHLSYMRARTWEDHLEQAPQPHLLQVGGVAPCPVLCGARAGFCMTTSRSGQGSDPAEKSFFPQLVSHKFNFLMLHVNRHYYPKKEGVGARGGGPWFWQQSVE